MTARYYATVATMAAHSRRTDLRAKALGRLVDALGNGRATPHGTYVHDGTHIVDADAGAARLLGGRPVGLPVLALMPVARRAEAAPRLETLRAGRVNAPWRGALVRLDGLLVQVRATVRHVTHEGAPAYRVDLTGIEHFD